MTKQCATEGCVAEIEQWQTYCSKHYAEMMAQQKQQQAQPVQQPVQQQQMQPQQIRQAQPVQQQQMQPPELPKSVLPQNPVPHERYKIPEQEVEVEDYNDEEEIDRPTFNELTADTKLQIRIIAFNGAVEMLKTTKIETKKFEQLIGEIETLTNTFSNIIMTDYDV